MISQICCNCEHATRVNTYYEDINGNLHPHDAYFAHCAMMNDYVNENDTCDDFKSCIKTVKVQYLEKK